MDLFKPQAITLDNVLQQTAKPQALVSAQPALTLCTVNSSYASCMQNASPDAFRFGQPRSEIPSSGSSIVDWTSLLEAACMAMWWESWSGRIGVWRRRDVEAVVRAGHLERRRYSSAGGCNLYFRAN